MATLAREYHWTERYILWELPLVRALQYQHAALRFHDVWTVPYKPPEAAVEEADMDDLLAEDPAGELNEDEL